MCAPQIAGMDDRRPLARFNSLSSRGTTLVGSEPGEIALPAYVSTDAGQASLASPSAPIEGSRPWIYVDSESDMLLRELGRHMDYDRTWVNLDSKTDKPLRGLARRHDPQAEKALSLAKGAARIKAWVRQTKLGFDIRLRRRLNADQDEVHDFSIIKEDPWPAKSEDPGLPLELPSSNVFELADTSVLAELPEAGEARIDSLDQSADDMIPRYVLRDPGAPVIRDLETLSGPAERDQSAVSGAAEVTATALPAARDGSDRSSGEISNSSKIIPASTTPDADLEARLNDRLNAVQTLLRREKSMREKLELVLTALRTDDTAQSSDHDKVTNPFRGLKVERVNRYETETDVEPQSPARLTPKDIMLKRAAREQKKLKRQPTRLEKTPANAGAEAIWTALIVAQAKLLGAEHPLVFKAKHSLALSRQKQHQNCPASLLSALHESKTIGEQNLGQHPLVETFAADLETLESVIVDPAAKVDPSNVPNDHENQEESTTLENSINQETEKYFQSLQKMRDTTSPRSVPRPTLILPETGTTSPTERVATASGSAELQWDVPRPMQPPRNSALILSGLIFQATLSLALRSMEWIKQNYGPEPVLEPGKVRVRWACSCGQQLYDDFTENRPGAARALEAYLNRPRTHVKSHTSGNSPVSPSGHSLHSSNNFPPSSQTSWSSIPSSKPNNLSPSDSKNPFRTASTLPTYFPYIPPGESLWLLICANEERFTPKVAHLDMSPQLITSDRRLGLALREHYGQLRQRWWHALGMRELTRIEFVQFECHRNRFADIRKSPDMPPRGSEEYAFVPGDLMPPVGPQYLLHLFRHPEDYDDELITYQRAPKRTARLNGGVGWGFHMVEGFGAARIWMLLNVVFGLVSLIFAIAWACERNDVQGAFGVAQWISAVAVLVAGWVQAYIT